MFYLGVAPLVCLIVCLVISVCIFLWLVEGVSMLVRCLFSLLSLLCNITNVYIQLCFGQLFTPTSPCVLTLQQPQLFQNRLLPDGIHQLPAQAWVSVHAQREGGAGHLPEAEDSDEVRVQFLAMLWGRCTLYVTCWFSCIPSVLVFPPLPSRLRYLIHNHVEELLDLCTFSVGESSCRRVVVCHSELRFGTEFPQKHSGDVFKILRH